MKLLFIFSHPRTCGYILPAVERLADNNDVFYFQYHKMSSKVSWPETSPDLRPAIYKRLNEIGAVCLGEPKYAHSKIYDTYSGDFREAINGHSFDLAILDINKGKLAWGTPLLYRILRRKGVPVAACQEGSVEDDEKGLAPISQNLGLAFDYCFCIGGFDEERLLRRNPNLSGRIYSVGVPSNDVLRNYYERPVDKKHILLVTSWTDKAGATYYFQPMTDDLIKNCGIYEIAEKAGLPVLIKEKTRPEYAFKHLESERVHVTMDETDLDRIVAESRYVIGAPSTLLFKSAQLRIPTAVLGKPRMGQLGVFGEFEGLTDSTAEQVKNTLYEQERKGGAGEAFIERAIKGGATFTSADRFVDAVARILEAPAVYDGPLSPDIKGFEKIAMRYPLAYKKIQGAYHMLKEKAGR